MSRSPMIQVTNPVPIMLVKKYLTYMSNLVLLQQVSGSSEFSSIHISFISMGPPCSWLYWKCQGIMCFYKYKVSITTKFLMMKWKTGPCDRSKAYISDRIAANLASTPLIPQQNVHTHHLSIYTCKHIIQSQNKSSHHLISNPYFLLPFLLCT